MDSAGGYELFESYEQDFEAIKVSINERLSASGSQAGGNNSLLPSLVLATQKRGRFPLCSTPLSRGGAIVAKDNLKLTGPPTNYRTHCGLAVDH